MVDNLNECTFGVILFAELTPKDYGAFSYLCQPEIGDFFRMIFNAYLAKLYFPRWPNIVRSDELRVKNYLH
jgi:hypothetical protein